MTVLVAPIVVSGHSISSRNSRKWSQYLIVAVVTVVSGHSISRSSSTKWSQY